MKKILCFGDSNVYGYIPLSGKRYDKNIRWTGILQTLCGNNYEIIEAGCNNRTAFCNNPEGIMQTGYKILPEYMKNNPDIVIFSIGINDLQKFYNPAISEIKEGITKLIDIAYPSKIILLAPPKLNENILKANFSILFDETSIAKSLEIGKIYQHLASEKNCGFIDLDKFVKVSQKDGLHFEPEQHKIIAQTVFEKLKTYLE